MQSIGLSGDGRLIPVEVKSADKTGAKSLKAYMETYKPDYAIKLSAKNFHLCGWMLS